MNMHTYGEAMVLLMEKFPAVVHEEGERPTVN